MPEWTGLRRLAAVGVLAAMGLASPAGATGLTHGPMVGALRTDSVVVWGRWDVPGTARIRYRPTGLATLIDGPTATVAADKDFTGSFSLTGLKANTSYLYTVEFTADTGEKASTPNAWFRTPAKLPSALSFVVLADFMTKETWTIPTPRANPARRSTARPRTPRPWWPTCARCAVRCATRRDRSVPISSRPSSPPRLRSSCRSRCTTSGTTTTSA